jgi:hypothetical protein
MLKQLQRVALCSLTACGQLAAPSPSESGSPGPNFVPAPADPQATREGLEPVLLGDNATVLAVSTDESIVVWSEESAGRSFLRLRDLAKGPDARTITLASALPPEGFTDVHLSDSGALVAFAVEPSRAVFVSKTRSENAGADPVVTKVGDGSLYLNVAFWPGRDVLVYVAKSGAGCLVYRSDGAATRVVEGRVSCEYWPTAFEGKFSPNRRRLALTVLNGVNEGRPTVYDIASDSAWRPDGARAPIFGSWFSDDDHLSYVEYRGSSPREASITVRGLGDPADSHSYHCASTEVCEPSPTGAFATRFDPTTRALSVIRLRTNETRLLGEVSTWKFTAQDARLIVSMKDGSGTFALDPATNAAPTYLGEDASVASPLNKISSSPSGKLIWSLGTSFMDLRDLSRARVVKDTVQGATVSDAIGADQAIVSSNQWFGPIHVYDVASATYKALPAPLDTDYGRTNQNGAFVARYTVTPDRRRMVVSDMYDLHEGTFTLHPTLHAYLVDPLAGQIVKEVAQTDPGNSLLVENVQNAHVFYRVLRSATESSLYVVRTPN